jgi:hypothetical protein
MKAKEKAEELFTKFADIEHLGVYGSYDGTWEWSSSLWKKQAKESALIAVDEIIKHEIKIANKIHSLPFLENQRIEVVNLGNYWNEVKQEIEKL